MEEHEQSEGAEQTKAQRYREIVATPARHGMSGDLLPDTYRTELMKLQDNVPTLPGAAGARVIREELGASPEKLFASFDSEAMGSASIGQVHTAKLKDGRDVVVKIRRPGIERVVAIDLEILQDLADGWSERFPVLEQYDVRGLVREFADTLRAELDYRREAANVLFFREVFAKERGFTIPQVVEEYTGARVIGLAIVMLVYHPEGWQRWIGVAFWAGVTVAFLFATHAVWAMFRKKRQIR